MRAVIGCLLAALFVGCCKPETVYVTQKVNVPVAVMPKKPELPPMPQLEIIDKSDTPGVAAGKIARNLQRLLLYSQELERIFSALWSEGNDPLKAHPNP